MEIKGNSQRERSQLRFFEIDYAFGLLFLILIINIPLQKSSCLL